MINYSCISYKLVQNFEFKIFILLLLIGCSAHESNYIPERLDKLHNLTAYPSDTEPEATIRFLQEESYGSTDSTFVTVGGSVGSIMEVDKAGRVFIADRKLNSIHVFKADGQYLTKLGSKGKGPGEFLSIRSMKIQSNNLYVYDSLQLRFNVFSLDSLKYSHTINLHPQDWSHIEKLKTKVPTDYFVSSESSLVIKFTPHIQAIENMRDKNYTHSYYYINKQGEIISREIFKQRGTQVAFTNFQNRRFSVSLSFRGEPLMVLSSDGYIFSAWTEDFLVKVYDPNGEYIRAFYHSVEQIPLTRDDLIEKYDLGIDTPNLKYIKNADLPATWPVMQSMLIDGENRLWVSKIVDNFEVYQWWVLDPSDGSLLARFEWPREEPIEEVRNGYMYTRGTDEMDVRSIVKYKIKME